MHEGRIVLGLGKMVEVVGVLAQVDEFSARYRRDRTRARPGRDRQRNIRRTIRRAFFSILASGARSSRTMTVMRGREGSAEACARPSSRRSRWPGWCRRGRRSGRRGRSRAR